MKKIIYLLIILAVIVLTMVPLSASAEGEPPTARIYANDVTVTADHIFSVTVYASDFESVGAIDLYAFYDPEVFTITAQSVTGLFSGEQTTANTSTPGEAQLSMISASGVSGSGSIWRLNFRAKAGTVAGGYNIVLAVGDAYSTALTPITIGSTSPRVTVNSSTVAQKSLSLYNSGGAVTVYNGDTVTVSFAANNANGLASAEFEVEYDKEIFEFKSLSLNSKLTNAANALYSINSDIPGYIKISYAATAGITGLISPMISLVFDVVADEACDTEITLKASSIYDSDLNSIKGSTVTKEMEVAERVEAPTLPKINVSGFDGWDSSFDVVFTAPGTSGLAAIDFVVRFDPTRVACTALVCEADGCFVISNVNNDEGVIKFSFISEDGISEDTEIAKLTFSREGLLGGAVKLEVVGKNAADSDFEDIAFEYVSPTLMCHVPGDAPTCTVAQSCIHCGKVFLPPIGHDEIHHNAKAPTCTEIGWDAYVTCSRCDYTTYGEISALGHTISEWDVTVLPTCKEAGEKKGACDACGFVSVQEIAALGHDIVNHSAKAATCTENGWKAYKDCTRCDYTTKVVIKPKGHRYTSDPDFEPTCTEPGIVNVRVCLVCSHVTYTEVPPLGHDYVLEEYAEPTCIDKGCYIYNCSRCWSQKYEEIPALGHDTVNHSAKAVTCTEDGWNAYKDCTRCDYTTKVIIKADGHKYVSDPDLEPTCTEPGIVDVRTCVACHHVTYTEVPPLGHDEMDHEPKAPTCTEIGWDTYVTCSRCDYTTYKEISALGHDAIHHSGKAPTCTEIGYEAYDTCSRCDYTTYKEISALGHDVIHHSGKAPTCTEIGYEAYDTCSRCDYTTYKEISALGHDAIHHSGKAPTCTEIGWDTYVTCSRCDYTTYKELSALGHDTIHHGGKAPTCTEIGYEAYDTCTRCDHTTYKEISALGHDAIHHSGKAPTCTEIGYEAYDTCSRCDHTTYKEISALGHDAIHHVGKAPTCTEAGFDAYDTCSRCDYTTYKELPSAGGHAFGKWTQTVAPGFESVGEERRDCSRCDYHEVREIPALGYKQVFIDAVYGLLGNEFGENAYNEIYAAIELYKKLTPAELAEVEEYLEILNEKIEEYNSAAERANGEMEDAIEIAFVPVSVSLSFLGALWLLLKKKFFTK